MFILCRLQLSPNESEAYFNTILALDLLRYPYYYLSNQFATKNVKGNVFPIPPEDITDVMEKVTGQACINNTVVVSYTTVIIRE